MVNTVIDIKNIEWGKNTVPVGGTTFIKVTISEIITDTVQSSHNSSCGQIFLGQQVKSEVVFKP